MTPTLYRSCRRIAEVDIQALAEFLRTANRGETQLHRLLEQHPAIMGALGYIEFLSEYPLVKRDNANTVLSDPKRADRADILAARLDVAPDLSAQKFANIIEIKASSANVLVANGRRSSKLNTAISELRDYSTWLKEVPANKESLAKYGWGVWKPSAIVLMGARDEFQNPGHLEKLKQELIESDGVHLVLVDELLAKAEWARKTWPPLGEVLAPIESLAGYDPNHSELASLIVASGGLAGLLLAHRKLEDNMTGYGDVDLREGLPDGLVHLTLPRLQPLARKLDIPYATALRGFVKASTVYGRMYVPDKKGIVVADFDKDALLKAFEDREVRNRPRRERAALRRVDAKHKPIVAFGHGIEAMFPRLPQSIAQQIAIRATKHGRVGTNRELTKEEATWLAVAAHAAYGHLGFRSKAQADESRDRVLQLLREWGGPNPAIVLRPFLRQ